MEITKINIKSKGRNILNIISILFLILLLFNYSSCEDCPREKPILKDEECVSIYCNPEDFKNKRCIISNPFIQTQWLNRIRYFHHDDISHICASTNSRGELFLIAQGYTPETAGDKFIYAYSQDGNGLFKNQYYDSQFAFFTIDLPDNAYPELFYSVELDNTNYLLASQTGNEMVLIDYISKSYNRFTFNSSAILSDVIFELKETEEYNQKMYFTDYIHCKTYETHEDCYLGLRLFQFTGTDVVPTNEINDQILVNPRTRLNCFQNDFYFIECVYSSLTRTEEGEETYNRVLTFFDSQTLKPVDSIILQSNFGEENSFDSSIHLTGKILVTGFSIPFRRNTIKLFLKRIIYTEDKEILLMDYLPDIDHIKINEDNRYDIEKGLAKRNHMVKISSNKFAILLNDYTGTTIYNTFNTRLVVLMCNIFENSRISIRHYRIDLKLHNLEILEDLRAYTLNNFFGVLVEAGYNTSDPRAAFFTFGYINSTFDLLSLDSNLKENTTDSVIRLGNYIGLVENNLFAYKFLGIKIIKLPDRSRSGYFINVDTNEEVQEGDFYNMDTVLRFILVREIDVGVEFSIDFAGVVAEPDFDAMNKNAEKIDVYPDNDTELERDYYSPRILIGRVVKYLFELNCYDSCETCYKLSNNPADHQCIKCKNNYYMLEGTRNCYRDDSQITPKNCPREKPILKDEQCVSTYCNPEEFKAKSCVISNPFIQTQWLNRIHYFHHDDISHVCASSNSNGDLFLIAQGYTEQTAGDKFIYAYSQDGNGLFKNEYYDSPFAFFTIDLPDNAYPELFYSVELDDTNYLLASQTGNEMVLIDYIAKRYNRFTFTTLAVLSDVIFELKETQESDQKVYFTDFIHCRTDETHNCYLGLRLFKFTGTDVVTLNEINDEILVNPLTRLNCFQNIYGLIECIYSSLEKTEEGTEIYNRVITFFDSQTLKVVDNIVLQDNYAEENSFDSSIHLTGNVLVTGFSIPFRRNIIKLLLKQIIYTDDKEVLLKNYLPNIDYIEINKDNKYDIEKGLAKRNHMIRITPYQFAILLNDYTGTTIYNTFNTKLVVLILNIFELSKISVRHYKIDMEWHNLEILEDLRAYTLNNFFGVLMEAGVDTNDPRAAFFTFGYINSTFDILPLDKNLKENTTHSIIRLGDYVGDIENNLFGYKFVGIKIIDLPDRSKSGYFIKIDTNREVREGDLYNKEDVLRFILVREINIGSIFSIDFAGVVTEPDFDEMNQNAEKVDVYPSNITDYERDYYVPRTLIGRVIKYRFEIECYESCASCYKLSNNPEDQQCIKCKSNYYMLEGTRNCYRKDTETPEEYCPREKPIMKDEECVSMYCNPQEYKDKNCVISNPFIRTQWLNRIHYFSKDDISHICASTNSRGELFLIAQGFTEQTAGDKFIYAYSQDGNGLFKNQYYDNQFAFLTIDLPDNAYPELFYSVEIDNSNYLLASQTGNEMVLIDYYLKNYNRITFNSSAVLSDVIFELKESENYYQKIYFTDYVHCISSGTHEDCYLGLRLFKFTGTDLITVNEVNNEILVNQLTRLNCFQNDYFLIECIYSSLERTEEGAEKYNRVITFFDSQTLKVVDSKILQDNYATQNSFDSSIHLTGNVLVTGFSIPFRRNIIKLLLKKIMYTEEKEIYLVNYLPDIDYIKINEDNKYDIEKGLDKRNHMVKISENQFAILLNDFTDASIYNSFNTRLVVLMFTIFDDSKISIRHYKINMEWHNLEILEDLRGYTLNNFFGVLLETGLNSTGYIPRATFFTFGYINSTFDLLPLDRNLKENTTNSIIRLGDYVGDIENNLFGYKFEGIKILKLPDRSKSGYFIKIDTNREVREGDIYNREAVIRFILARETTIGGVFSIDFAGVAAEPDFDEMNKNADRVDVYPSNNTELERSYYSPKTLIGRVIKYRFEIECYESCASCYKLSNNPEDHQCIQCKNNYIMKEGTRNCYRNESTITPTDCPREKPIMKDEECVSTYCNPEEFKAKTCVISNPFIQTQWLNRIHYFHHDDISHVCASSNSRGELFLIAQGYTPETAGDKFIYAYSQDGNGLFRNEYYDSPFSFFTIDLPDDAYPELFYSVQVDNTNYLLASQTGTEMVLIDYYAKRYHSFTFDSSAILSDIIFELKETDEYNQKTYFTDYIHCKTYETHEDCYLGLRLFKFTGTGIVTVNEKNNEILVNPLTRLNCFQNIYNFIECIYSSLEKTEEGTEIYNRVITFFDSETLKVVDSKILQDNYAEENSFDSSIHLTGNVLVTGFSIPFRRNTIKLLLKKIVYSKEILLVNYLPDIDYIKINEDNRYDIEKGLAQRNHMVRITPYQFAILLNDYTGTTIYKIFNSKLVVLILNIFEMSKISIRHYRIDMKLHNLEILEDLRAYTLNNFFGVLMEAGYNTSDPRAAFFTFGYVNSTFDLLPLDRNLKENTTDSIIRLGDYVGDIENNLFAYRFVGIKIIKVPDRSKCGYFINVATNEEVREGDFYKKESVLRFILVREIDIGTEFSIDFAGVVVEPEFDEMNKNAEKIDVYPTNDTELERKYYAPKTLIGRVIRYRFEIDCFSSCASCYRFSNNEADHQCITCKNNYYFLEGTRNCYKELDNHYLDESTNTLKSCSINCATCSAGPIVELKKMNCLSCKPGYQLYESTNCLSCPKYVNYDLTECLDKIPNGYYLQDPKMRTLGKCHELCKTCNEGPELWSMNCLECKYTNPNYTPVNEGDCPSEGYYDAEEEPMMPGGECPRSKPILVRNDFCAATYCSPEEISQNLCSISNSIIRGQWMNNIQRFGEGNLMSSNLDYGVSGELFLMAQKRETNDYKNVLYAVDNQGGPYFYDNTKKEYFSYLNLDFPEDIYLENFRILENPASGNVFMLSTQFGKEMYEINFWENEVYVHLFHNESDSSQSLFALKNDPSQFFTSFIHCEYENDEKYCYPYTRLFKFEGYNVITILKENKGKEPIYPYSNLICFEQYENYIQCSYIKTNTNYKSHILGLINRETLALEYVFEMEVFIGNELTTDFFDSMISLNDEAFVNAYSTENNNLKVTVNYLVYDELREMPIMHPYVENVPYIILNQDNYYSFEDVSSKRNSMCKINENKFAILLNINDDGNENYGNHKIIIYIFNIFGDKSYISVKKYSIDFKLYNMVNYGKVMGYNLGQFFGILVDLSSPKNKDIVSSAFMTFGFINTTEPSFIFDRGFIQDNSGYSKSIRFSKYIGQIENNLFGYEMLGAFILALPGPEVGYFFNSNEEVISISDILPLNSEVKFKLNKNYLNGNYSIVFAGIISEPNYDKMKKYAEEIIIYPEESNVDETHYYEPGMLIGKRFEYSFEVTDGQGTQETNCYPSCETCIEKSGDDESHLCLTCKSGYYFKEGTNNCYNEIDKYYYFDKEKQMFSHCYIGCLTCDAKEISSTYMNCLSCPEGKNYYGKTKNCLSCARYVNYEQTGCIDEVPDGYYVSDETLKTIEKCFPLCKTCKIGPVTVDNILHMNCDTCRYTNEDFHPASQGDCPSSDKSPDEDPVDGQCPKNKPILKDNKCRMIYCTKEEFDKGTCKIYNQYTATQWFNKFHIFDDSLTTCVAYDVDDKGNLFLLAQRKEPITNKYYLYGFNSNGRGILYEKTKNDYTSFKVSTYELPGYIYSIKYIVIDYKPYIVNILKNFKHFYLINYNDNEISSNTLFYSPYSVDTIKKLKNKDDIYLFDFVYCLDEYIYENCYIGFLNYRISKDVFAIEKSNTESLTKIDYNSKLTCYENSYNHIQCKYSLSPDEIYKNYKEEILELFDRENFSSIQKIVLDKFTLDKIFFDTMIEFNDNSCVIAYSYEPNLIKVLVKSLVLDENKKYYNLEDYLVNIPQIIINEDAEYELNRASPFRNSLLKLNDNEFVMLLSNYNEDIVYSHVNSAMVIITFKIFNNKKNVIVRHYRVNFNLYNRYIDGDLLGYKLNGFFGALMELTSPGKEYMSNSAFLTFGYVNTTEDVSVEEGTANLITNQQNIKVSDYIKGIENNLFGYTLVGVKIMSLPDEKLNVGFFTNGQNLNMKIYLYDVININSEISFHLHNNAPKGKYYISFAGVVKEPEYQKMNEYANKVDLYPKGSSPNNYPEEKILVGKEFRYNFEIRDSGESGDNQCYESCDTCVRYSNNPNEQYCLRCKTGYYFKDGTQNCYKEIANQYYFNKETNTFSPCYKDCFTCQEKEINSTHMNCLSCHNLYQLYSKSSNCLKCPKYVNYEQTECIDDIPDGYYLAEQNTGVIDKCHELCKTCKGKSSVLDGVLHMNCDTCLYKDDGFNILIKGNCPDHEREKKEKKSSGGTFAVVMVILALIIIIVVAVIIYKKKKSSSSTKPERQKLNTDYYNIGGKNIPFDEDNNFGIN